MSTAIEHMLHFMSAHKVYSYVLSYHDETKVVFIR